MDAAVACGLLHGHSAGEHWRTLSGVSDVKTSFGLTLVRRDDDGVWDLYCAALTSSASSSPLRVFEATAQVSQGVVTGNALFGLSTEQNTLYKGELQQVTASEDWNETGIGLSVKMSKVKNPGGLKLIQLTSTDESAFVLDDASGIHEVTKGEELVLRWKIEGTRILRVECGFAHFIALSDTGAVYSWGSGGRGELGHGDLKMDCCDKPKRVDFFDDLESIVKDLAVGGWHTLALTSDGDVYSWGWNASGQLGHSGRGVPYPVDLGDGDDPIVRVAAGARNSAVMLKSGDLYTWGYNKHGQLGLGDREDRREPHKVPCSFKGSVCGLSCARWSTVVYTKVCK